MAMTTFGERVRDTRLRLNLTQKQLAKKSQISQATVAQIENGRNKGSTYIVQLANALKVTPQWLGSGVDIRPFGANVAEARADYNVSPPPEVKRRVPVISWVAAGTFCCSDDPFPPGVADEWVNATASVGPRAYALRVDGDSMEPRFPDGCTIIVDPDREPRHKSFIVVRLDGSDQATFKQLIIEGGKRYLKPLNPRYPIMELAETAVICGVVRQSLQVETFE